MKHLHPVNTRQPFITIPATILSHNQLSFNQKLMLGLDYSFSQKLGYNSLSNKELSIWLNLHVNIISYCRRHLVKMNFLRKEGRKYYLTQKHEEFQIEDKRDIIIPSQVYMMSLTAGAKLLWGEYNSISRGKREYFASREFTAKRLNCSVESVTNWTTLLFDQGLISNYKLEKGYCKSQKSVITTVFD